MSTSSSPTNGQENPSPDAEAQAQAERIQELEGQLIELLRRKYKLYWRRKESAAAPEASKLQELRALQAEIKDVFDQIRLLDKKYVVPTFKMFD